MNWKKRGQKGWTGRKTAKELSKSRERQFGESEVSQQLQEDFEGDSYRYTGGKKSKNVKAQIKHRISYYETRYNEELLKEEARRAKGETVKYCFYFSTSSYKYRIQDLKDKLKKIEEKE